MHHGVVISWVRIDYANPLPRIHGFNKLVSWSCYVRDEKISCLATLTFNHHTLVGVRFA